MRRGVAMIAMLAAAFAAAAEDHGHGDLEGTPADFLSAATTLVERRQAEEAVGLLSYGLGEYPLDRELNTLYVNLVTEQGLEELARAEYDERLATFGEEPILLWALGRLAPDATSARAFYERALKTDPAFAPAHLGLADLALKKDDLEAAATEIDAALAADAGDRRAYGWRGFLRLERGELEDAAEDFNRALKDESYAPATHAALGGTYYLLGNYEAAAEEYRAAIALNADRGVYYLGLGQTLEAAGQLGAARLNYRAAANRAEGDVATAVSALKSAGRLAYLSGETTEARGELSRAAALAPADAEAHGLLGIVYMMENRASDAAAAFEAATANEPSRADWWYYLGVNRADAGDYAGAEAALLKAREALTTFNRADDKVTTAEIDDALAAARAARASP